MPTRTLDGLITLSSDKLRQFAVDALLHDVHLHINGTKCTLATVYDLILKASAGQTSISDVCDDTPGAPSGTAKLKPRQLRVRFDVALDLVLVPYHGEPAQNPEEVRRSEARHNAIRRGD